MKENAIQYTLKEICDLIGVPVPEWGYDDDEKFTNVSYHPHFIQKGGAFFIGGKTDVDFGLRKALETGVKVVFLSKEHENHPGLQAVPHVFCENPFVAVTKIGADIRNRKGLTVVGITGSLGKTTTKDFIHSVLSQKYDTTKSLGNQNTIYPLFNNLQKIQSDFFIQEFGAGTPGVMPTTVKACIPDAGVITNISDPHLDVFFTKENILNEKLKMLEVMPEGCPAFLNYDDELLKKVTLDRPVISYAVYNEEGDYHVENIREMADSVTFDIISAERRSEVTMYAHGTYNISNAVVAYAIGEFFGLTEDEIVRGIASYRPVGIRQNLVNIGGYNLYVDCYNNAPVSLVGAVEVLAKLPIEEGGRRVAVISDIDRLGEKALEKHGEVAHKIAEQNFDMAICFGNENAKCMADIIKAAGIETYYTSERDQLDGWLREKLTRKDVVLVKGAVIRLLSRTIDNVFGTSMQINSEQFERITMGEFDAKVIWEKEHLDRKTIALLKYNGKDEKPVIPTESHGAEVFSIGPMCFKQNNHIKRIRIPAPITNVAKGAFRGCKKLRSVTLPETLKMIEANAFRNCISIKEVRIPKNVIEIGDSAFEGCRALKTVYIPKSIGRVGEDAFKGCPGVELVYYEKSYEFQRFMRMSSKKKIKYIKGKIKKLIKK